MVGDRKDTGSCGVEVVFGGCCFVMLVLFSPPQWAWSEPRDVFYICIKLLYRIMHFV